MSEALTTIDGLVHESHRALGQKLAGSDIAEMEIEARRDAHELRCLNQNPYPKGSFQSLCYTHELTKLDGSFT